MIFKAEPAGGKKGPEEVNGTKEETEALKSAAWKTALYKLLFYDFTKTK